MGPVLPAARTAHCYGETLMANIGTLPGERLAGLSADLFHKLQRGNITLDELALFTQHKNPFTFERNEHGHIVLNVTGLYLDGAQEIERLDAASYRISGDAKSCLLSVMEDGYDAMHRLMNRQYKVVLMPIKDIENENDHTTDNLYKRGTEKYGYIKPVGGVMPRVREQISDGQMEDIGIYYIVAFHEPIKNSNGDPYVLCIDRNDGGRWLDASVNQSGGGHWDDGGCVAFLAPEG